MKTNPFLLAAVLLLGFTNQYSMQHEDDARKDNVTYDTASCIQPSSEYPGYWEYKGHTVLLLGAFNHGHNPFIDGSTLDAVSVDDMSLIIAQMDEMSRAGGNLLRCVLDPGLAASRGVHSYKRDKSGKVDLDFPEGEYWERLSVFITEAEKRDVIVELEIWDRFDWQRESWEFSPFNPQNNINYTAENTNLEAAYERHEIYHRHPMALGVPGHPLYRSAGNQRKNKYDRVRKYQEVFVSKVYEIAKAHRNVLYNMNNETSEHPAWGEYWIQYLKKLAEKENKKIVCTNMQDAAFRLAESQELMHQLNHPEIYDYLDISQINSRLRDEEHWNAVKWMADQSNETGLLLHMIKLYGNDEREPGPWRGWKPGDTDNAIEEWWRNLIAGVAGVRFHRPKSGIGLSSRSKACIGATRKIESKVKFWNVSPSMELLSNRDVDEAYLAADPGNEYILYFSHQGGGSVGLDLEKYTNNTFKIHWVNSNTGEWGPKTLVDGGSIQQIERPDDSAQWVAAIKKTSKG